MQRMLISVRADSDASLRGLIIVKQAVIYCQRKQSRRRLALCIYPHFHRKNPRTFSRRSREEPVKPPLEFAKFSSSRKFSQKSLTTRYYPSLFLLSFIPFICTLSRFLVQKIPAFDTTPQLFAPRKTNQKLFHQHLTYPVPPSVLPGRRMRIFIDLKTPPENMICDFLRASFNREVRLKKENCRLSTKEEINLSSGD